MKKFSLITLILVVSAICLLLVGCGKCEHTYDSNCDTTCNECGEARQTGVAHTYYGDCDDACHKCKEKREPLKEHEWVQISNDISCSARQACEGCGAINGNIVPHTWQEATCQAPKSCTVCGATESELLEHIREEDDYDCTTALKCQNCDYIFVNASSHSVNEETLHSNEEAHFNKCTNEGCEVQFNTEEHSGEDDGDCTTWVLCKCGWLIKEANESHTAEEDDGDCTTAVKCINCEQNAVEAKAGHSFNDCICTECGTAVHAYDPGILCSCLACGQIVHTPDENCICSVCGTPKHKEIDKNTGVCYSCNDLIAAASIIINGTKSYYNTIEDAVDVVIQNGEGTIVLENDVLAEYVFNIENYSITLDLNGKTLNSNSNYAFRLFEGGSLTIKDSVGTGVIANDISTNGDSLVIEGGKLEGTVYSGSGEVNITGGEFYLLVVNADKAKLAISGGSFAGINIFKDYNTPAGILKTGYCYYDSEGNKIDASTIEPEEYWYKLRNVTVGKDE